VNYTFKNLPDLQIWSLVYITKVVIDHMKVASHVVSHIRQSWLMSFYLSEKVDGEKQGSSIGFTTVLFDGVQL